MSFSQIFALEKCNYFQSQNQAKKNTIDFAIEFKYNPYRYYVDKVIAGN